MTNSIETSLVRIAASTFEQVAFLVADVPPNAEQAAAEPEADAWLEFRGPVEGVLQLRICGGLLPVVSENLLGVADEPAEASQLDALGELANMICGGVLPVLAPGRDFRQMPPRVGPAGAAPPEGARAIARTVLGLEGGRAEATLFVRPGGGEAAA